MAKTVSQIRASVVADGVEWSPDLYQYAISRGAIDDEGPPAPLAPFPQEGPLAPADQEGNRPLPDLLAGWMPNPMTGVPTYNPLLSNLSSGVVGGATFGAVRPEMATAASGVAPLDYAAERIAPQVGELLGMGLTMPLVPAPLRAAGPQRTAIGRAIGRALPAMQRLGGYGAASGGIEAAREGGGAGDIALGAAERGLQDIVLGAAVGGLPAIPARLGGEYAKSALLGAGLGASQGGVEGALSGAISFPLAHAVAGGVSGAARGDRRARQNVGAPVEGQAPLPMPPAAPKGAPGAPVSQDATQATIGPGAVPEVAAGAGGPPAGGPRGLLADVGVGLRPPDYSRRPVNERGRGLGSFVSEAVRSVEGQLERTSPAGRKLARAAREVIDVQRENVGLYSEPLVSAGISKLSPAEDLAVFRALEGRVAPETLSQRARGVYDLTRKYIRAVPARAREVGLRVRVRGKTEMVPEQQPDGTVTFKKVKRPSQWVEFPQAKENYAPHIFPDVERLGKPRAGQNKVRNQILDRLEADGVFADRAAAEAALDSYIKIIKSGGRTTDLAFAEHLVKTGQAESIAEAKGMVLRFARQSKQRAFGPIERAREFDNPFYDPSVRRAIPSYIGGTERRLAETQYYGQRNEKINRILGRAKTTEERDSLLALIDSARGIQHKEPPGRTRAAASLRRMGSLHLNPLTAIKNIGQLNNILMATDTRAFLSGVGSAMTSHGRRLAHSSGATAGVVLRDVEGVGGASSRYFRAIGMTGTEMFLRSAAANAGINYARRMARALARNPGDTFARHELQKLRLDPQKIIEQGGELSINQLRRAGFKLSDRTQFGYTPLDVPAWFNDTALGRLASQFKPYGVQQSRFLIQQVADEARAGNYGRATRNLVLLLAVYPATGEIVNDVSALVAGKKREAELVSLRRYLENIMVSGVTNILVDGATSAYYGSFAKALLGAAPGTAAEATEIAARGVKNGKLSKSDMRRLYRLIPVVGPITAYRVFPKEDQGGGGASSARQPQNRSPAPRRAR